MVQGDKVRRECFKKTGFIPDNLIFTVDLNLKSTVERGILQNNIKSVKLIFEQIFTKVNRPEYNQIFMMDLPKILDQKKLVINEFFDRSYTELQTQETDMFCNME